MSDEAGQRAPGQAAEPDLGSIFDDSQPVRLACLVCGALVPSEGDFPRVHWDWHDASNGA